MEEFICQLSRQTKLKTLKKSVYKYHGEHENELEFAIQLFDDCFMDSIPVPVQGYIDYASYKRDLFMSDFFSIEVGGKTHVFARR